jgi:hypothetical protein
MKRAHRDCWRFTSALDDFVVTRGWDVQPEESRQRLGPLAATARVEAWLGDPATRDELLRLHRATAHLPATSDVQVVRELKRDFESGALVVLASERRRAREQPPAEAPAEERPAEAFPDPTLTWIEIELVDDTGAPVGNKPYRVELPDGLVREGRLNDAGFARLDGIVAGDCKVSFPTLDGWARA